MIPEKSPEFWAALGTAIGVAGSRLFVWIFRRGFSEADQIRKELRERTKFLEDKISNVYDELDEWREKYYKAVEQNNELKAECHSLRLEIELLKVETHRSSIKDH